MKDYTKRLKEIGLKRFLMKAFFYDEVYTVGIRNKQEYQNGRISTALPFSLIKESDQYWIADPLLYKDQSKNWLFVEYFDQLEKRGKIAVIDPDAQRNEMNPRVILSESYHMSFPMVFEWNQEVFMIPETSENHSINLYRCIKMPFQWEKVKTFQTEVMIVDSVVIEQQRDKVVLLGSAVNPDNELEVRFLKYEISQSESGFTMTLSEENTLFCFNERNGGQPLTIDGERFLLTQNSTSVDYGVSFSVSSYEKDRLLPVQTITKEQLQFSPAIDKKSIIGVHTYSATEQFEVTDVRYLKFDPLLNIKRVKKLLKRK